MELAREQKALDEESNKVETRIRELMASAGGTLTYFTCTAQVVHFLLLGQSEYTRIYFIVYERTHIRA